MTNTILDLFNISNYGVITFNTTHQALRSENILKDSGANFLLIPTPRQISASCGMAVKFVWIDRDLIIKTLRENDVQWQSIHHISKENENDR